MIYPDFIYRGISVVARRNVGLETTTPSGIITIQPALDAKVQLDLTVVYTVLYSLLFIFVYVQLWMIFWYRHKRLSYQTVFLFLCLIWSGIRTTLFSFYYKNYVLANTLSPVPYWILFCFPVCIQFITLCLLVLFFAQVCFKCRARYEPNRYKKPLWAAVIVAVIVFITTNVVAAVLTKNDELDQNIDYTDIILARVIINEALFLIFAIALAVCIYKISRMSSANLVLEAKGTSKWQAMAACVVIVVLFTSRVVYNVIAICNIEKMPGFGYDWVNVSDEADQVNLSNGYAYLSFGIVLFVWEILPTFVVVMFFRVKRPQTTPLLTDASVEGLSPRAYFFDNPRRYDSEEDLSKSTGGNQADLHAPINGSPARLGVSYSSLGGSLAGRTGSYSQQMPGTTPPVMYAPTPVTPQQHTQRLGDET
ncbi:integral membrane protein GPR137B [Lingula anatina]|uniref:Integral membrane protein GPR137B n=1 Tax=Lingula anatina TaxID=7574 RepID=A0A1S3HBI9_LINAN|nr:integral membrane protein GPR137B [Lingula anatina]|eukprot:XP_013382886.1 integral membrane protein GPR137B [Lingula anatina]